MILEYEPAPEPLHIPGTSLSNVLSCSQTQTPKPLGMYTMADFDPSVYGGNEPSMST